MHKVQLMNPDLGPPTCLTCGRGNTPDAPDSQADFWAIDLERDVNWGDPAYICKYCARDVGELAGMVDAEEVEDLQTKIRSQLKKIHDLQAELDLRDKRLKRIVRGEREKEKERRERREKV